MNIGTPTSTNSSKARLRRVAAVVGPAGERTAGPETAGKSGASDRTELRRRRPDAAGFIHGQGPQRAGGDGPAEPSDDRERLGHSGWRSCDPRRFGRGGYNEREAGLVQGGGQRGCREEEEGAVAAAVLGILIPRTGTGAARRRRRRSGGDVVRGFSMQCQALVD